MFPKCPAWGLTHRSHPKNLSCLSPPGLPPSTPPPPPPRFPEPISREYFPLTNMGLVLSGSGCGTPIYGNSDGKIRNPDAIGLGWVIRPNPSCPQWDHSTAGFPVPPGGLVRLSVWPRALPWLLQLTAATLSAWGRLAKIKPGLSGEF